MHRVRFTSIVLTLAACAGLSGCGSGHKDHHHSATPSPTPAKSDTIAPSVTPSTTPAPSATPTPAPSTTPGKSTRNGLKDPKAVNSVDEVLAAAKALNTKVVMVNFWSVN